MEESGIPHSVLTVQIDEGGWSWNFDKKQSGWFDSIMDRELATAIVNCINEAATRIGKEATYNPMEPHSWGPIAETMYSVRIRQRVKCRHR